MINVHAHNPPHTIGVHSLSFVNLTCRCGRALSPISNDQHGTKEIESLEELYAGDSSLSDICDTLSDSESYQPSEQSDDSDSEYY